MSTYRVGNHQPQNVYRNNAYIGVMFTAEDAALVVEALNERVEQEATIQALKARLPYWAREIEGDVDWSKGDTLRAIDEMRQTASEL